MAKNSIDVYGASGKTNVLNFEPVRLRVISTVLLLMAS